MQNIDTFLTLDVYDYDLSPSTMKAIALDSNTRSVTAYITKNGQPYDVGQSNVTLTVIRPDGVGAQVTGEAFEYEASVEDTTVTRHGAYAELSPATLAIKGKLRAQFMFVNGDQVLRTEIFTINCGEALDSSTDTWAGEYQGYNLDELVQNVNESAAKVDAMEQDVSDLKSGFNDLYNTAYVTNSASGEVAHFVDGADNVPMKSVKVNIEPVQSGSGDPSPDNVRPISGFRSVKVMRTGKNLLKNSASSTTISGVTFTVNDDGSVTVNGTNDSATTISFHLGGEGGTFLALPEGSYTLSGCPSGGGATSYFLSLYHHGAGANNFGKFDFGSGETYELTAETNTGLGVRIGVISGQTVDNLTFYPMLRLASDTDDTYEQYNGNTYNISLSSAGTVYGGTLDVTSGELTVTHNVTNLNGSENGWFKSGITTVDVYCLPLTNNSLDGDTTLSHFNYVNQRNYNTAGCAWFDSDGKQLRIGYAASSTDLTAFKAWLASNNVQLFSKLDNPLTYNLAPTEVKSLLGINNVWSDAGNVEAEYRADTKLYIDKRLAEVTA